MGYDKGSCKKPKGFARLTPLDTEGIKWTSDPAFNVFRRQPEGK